MAQLDAASQRKARIVTLNGTRPLDQPGGAVRVAPLALVLGGLLAILLLACSNVGNLQLARAFARRRELATRLAIGANRGRIVRQLLTETLLVSAVVSAAALCAQLPFFRKRSFAPPARLAPMRVLPDMTVAAFTLVLCLIATIVTGLVPALRGTRDAADFSAASRGPFATRRAVAPHRAAGRPGRPQCHAALRRDPAHARPAARLEHRPGLFAAHGFGGEGHAAGAGVRCGARPRSSARSCATRSPRRTSDRWEWRTQRRCSRQHSATSVRRPQDAAADARRVHLRSYSAGTVHAAEDSRRHRAPVRRAADRRGRGQRVDGPRVLAGLDRRRSASDRWLANCGSGRRRPRRAVDRSRRGRAGDVHAADVPATYCRHS